MVTKLKEMERERCGLSDTQRDMNEKTIKVVYSFLHVGANVQAPKHI